MLGKYYFNVHSRRFEPFLSSGLSLRKIWYDRTVTQSGSIQKFSETSDLGKGAVAAAGVGIKEGRLTFSPEVRYTHWKQENGLTVGRNQAELLLGIRF